MFRPTQADTRRLQLWETYIRSSGVLIRPKMRYLLPPSSTIISLPNPCALLSVFYQFAVNFATLQRISGLENGCTVYIFVFWNVLQAVLHTLGGFRSCWPSDPVFLHLCYTLLRERHSHWEPHLTLLFFFSYDLFIVHEPIWCLMECILRLNLLRPIPRNNVLDMSKSDKRGSPPHFSRRHICQK